MSAKLRALERFLSDLAMIGDDAEEAAAPAALEVPEQKEEVRNFDEMTEGFEEEEEEEDFEAAEVDEEEEEEAPEMLRKKLMGR